MWTISWWQVTGSVCILSRCQQGVVSTWVISIGSSLGPWMTLHRRGHSMGVNRFLFFFPCSEPVECEAVLELLGKVCGGRVVEFLMASTLLVVATFVFGLPFFREVRKTICLCFSFKRHCAFFHLAITSSHPLTHFQHPLMLFVCPVRTDNEYLYYDFPDVNDIIKKKRNLQASRRHSHQRAKRRLVRLIACVLNSRQCLKPAVCSFTTSDYFHYASNNVWEARATGFSVTLSYIYEKTAPSPQSLGCSTCTCTHRRPTMVPKFRKNFPETRYRKELRMAASDGEEPQDSTSMFLVRKNTVSSDPLAFLETGKPPWRGICAYSAPVQPPSALMFRSYSAILLT